MRRRSPTPDGRLVRRAAWRLGVQTAAAIAVTVLVLSAIAVLVVLHDQHGSDDRLVDSALTTADDVVDPPAGIWLVVRTDMRQVASPGLPRGLPDTGELDRTAADRVSRSHELRVGGREYRVDTRPYGADGTIQAVLDLAANHAQRLQLVRALLITGAVGLLLAAVLSVWLARRAVAPLAQALALQRRFVADASHELRTPLTLLATRAQLIQRSLGHDPDPVTLRSDVDGVVQDSLQLAAILDDLLICADPRALTTSPVELTELVGDAVDAARPAAQLAGVQLDLSTTAGALTVPASAPALRRAVNALLDNAIRHATGRVWIRPRTHGRSAIVEISDDGPGIDPQLLPTLFDRFSAGPQGNPDGHRRYGLGLALVSEIATRHGGTIDADTASGGGARFRLTLPLTTTRRPGS
ncbi:MAG: sensor histidine kinase [Labedaea sp.]